MISVSTFAFALALVAVVLGALGWITWLHLTRELESLKSQIASFARSTSASIAEHKRLISDATRTAPANLAAEVAALGEAVAKLRQTHQRFAGRFDQYVGQGPPAAGSDRSYAGPNQLDPELQAELALQRAPSAAPGAR